MVRFLHVLAYTDEGTNARADIETRFAASYVSDYFKHVSLKTLKRMGLELLRKETNESEFLLYSICVNSNAMKFINTIISAGECSHMEEEMRASAEKYGDSALAASEQIHLLTESSFALLQALICSVCPIFAAEKTFFSSR